MRTQNENGDGSQRKRNQRDRDEAAELIIEELTKWAWEIRSTVIEKAKTDRKATGDKEMWEAAIAGVEKGHAIGPFEEEEVAKVVGSED